MESKVMRTVKDASFSSCRTRRALEALTLRTQASL